MKTVEQPARALRKDPRVTRVTKLFGDMFMVTLSKDYVFVGRSGNEWLHTFSTREHNLAKAMRWVRPGTEASISGRRQFRFEVHTVDDATLPILKARVATASFAVVLLALLGVSGGLEFNDAIKDLRDAQIAYTEAGGE